MEFRKILLLLGISTMALSLAVGCGKKKTSGDDDDDDDNTTQSIAVENFLNDSGTADFFQGECGAFTITGTNTSFAAGAVQMQFETSDGNAFTVNEAVFSVESPTSIRVGDFTDGPLCVILDASLFPTGTVTITVSAGGTLLSAVDALNITATPIIDLGTATDGNPVDSSAATETKANELSRQGDIDFYGGMATAAAATSVVGWFMDAGTNPGAAGPIPQIIADDGAGGFQGQGEGHLAFFEAGAAATIQTQAAANDLLLRGTGEAYTMELNVFDTITDLSGTLNDSVANAIDLSAMGPGVYLDQFDAANDTESYDPMNGASPPGQGQPNPATTCASQGSVWVIDALGLTDEPFGIYGGGQDLVYSVTLNDGETAYFGANSPGIDATGAGGDLVLYATTQANAPAPASTVTCEAGGDRFGPFVAADPSFAGTDQLVISNTTGGAVTYYVVVDQFTGDSGDAPFLLWFYLQ